MNGWKHSDLWKRDGKNFSVEIKRWGQLDRNVWNVYAYIKRGHALFDSLAGQEGKVSWGIDIGFDLHCGINYAKFYRNEKGEIYCVQVGDDWAHYGDEYYESCTDFDGAFGVVAEANALFEYLEAL